MEPPVLFYVLIFNVFVDVTRYTIIGKFFTIISGVTLTSRNTNIVLIKILYFQVLKSFRKG